MVGLQLYQIKEATSCWCWGLQNSYFRFFLFIIFLFNVLLLLLLLLWLIDQKNIYITHIPYILGPFMNSSQILIRIKFPLRDFVCEREHIVPWQINLHWRNSTMFSLLCVLFWHYHSLFARWNMQLFLGLQFSFGLGYQCLHNESTIEIQAWNLLELSFSSSDFHF